MDRGAWRAIVHRVTKSQAQLSNWARTHTGVHGLTPEPVNLLLPVAKETLQT